MYNVSKTTWFALLRCLFRHSHSTRVELCCLLFFGTCCTSYDNLRLLPYKYNSIESNVFERISAKTAATWDMLQLADVCTTSMFLMHEINGWGFTTPCFTLMLRKHLFENKGKVETYGIKYFVDDMRPDGSQMNEHWPCNKK